MKMLVLDGNSIANRAFYGIKALTTKDGFYTNAIYGFLVTLNKLIEEIKPDAIAVAFDMRTPTFRHNYYVNYKANRKGMPDELAHQIPVLKEILINMGIKIVECAGYEADDILGTLAKACEDSNNECVIATGDRDSLQLVSNKVSVRITVTKFGRPQSTLYNKDKINEIYGVEPEQLIDIKALQGDKSDNIPGVLGIGEKGASALIKEFKSIDNIYENIDTIKIAEGIRKKLINSKGNAFLSKYLGTIVKNVPIDTNFEDYIPQKMNKIKLTNILTDLEMFSLMKKMKLNQIVIPEPNTTDFSYNVIVNCPIENLENNILNNIKIFDFIITVERDKFKYLGFIVNKIVYIIDNLDEYLDLLKSIFENLEIKKRTYDVKTAFKVMKKLGINIKNVTMDVMLAAYVLNSSEKSYEIEKLTAKYKTEKFNVNCANIYIEFSKQVVNVKLLSEIFDHKFTESDQRNLLYNIEIPFAEVLADMENTGLLIDIIGLNKFKDFLVNNLKNIEIDVFKMIGKEFNLNSSKQLEKILFYDLQLPTGNKKRSGGYSTGAQSLESIKNLHPIVNLILKYRLFSNLKNTYCDALIEKADSIGRVHSNFSQTETKTGRISSLNPNLQNIPVRTEIGKQLRRFFCTDDGNVLIDADYSQIELRILAHVANEQNMIDAFNNNLDIHAITASQVFNVPESEVTPELRRRAKVVNFGIIYGMGAIALSKEINVTKKQAKEYINKYLSYYSGISDYIQRTIKFAQDNNYVQTIFGRRRYLHELTLSISGIQAFAKRVARNMPIQGTAADIIKIAMININKRFIEQNLSAKIILQVHDEIIVESPECESSKVAQIVSYEMEHAVTLKVPLLVDIKIGKTWYGTKE